jgi:hypothetical protein
MPDTENVVQLSKLFGVTTDYLLNDEYDADNNAPAVTISIEKEDDALSDQAGNAPPSSYPVSRYIRNPALWIIVAAVVIAVPLCVFLFTRQPSSVGTTILVSEATNLPIPEPTNLPIPTPDPSLSNAAIETPEPPSPYVQSAKNYLHGQGLIGCNDLSRRKITADSYDRAAW